MCVDRTVQNVFLKSLVGWVISPYQRCLLVQQGSEQPEDRRESDEAQQQCGRQEQRVQTHKNELLRNDNLQNFLCFAMSDCFIRSEFFSFADFVVSIVYLECIL